VSKAIVPRRLIIYGAQGKVRGVIENRVLRKGRFAIGTNCTHGVRISREPPSGARLSGCMASDTRHLRRAL